MKKTFLIIIALIFLTSGCSVNYQLEISDETFKESSTIYTDSSQNEQYKDSSLSNFLLSFENSYIPSFFNSTNYDDLTGGEQANVEYYTIAKYINGNDIGIRSSYDFSAYNLYQSRMINECFKEISLQKNEDTYRLNTSTGCQAFTKYPLLDDVTIKIVTEYNVISNNADEVLDNEYIWHINKDNYQDIRLNFSFNTVNQDLSKFDPTNIPDEVYVNNIRNFAKEHQIEIIIFMFVLFIALITAIIIYKRKKN